MSNKRIVLKDANSNILYPKTTIEQLLDADGNQFVPASNTAVSSATSSINSHIADVDNPHSVSKTQIGLSNVTNDKQIKGLNSGTTENHFVSFGTDGYTVKDSGKSASDFDAAGAASDVQDNLDIHIEDTDNPHGVTATQVGLGNVDNTSDLDKPISTATQEALDEKVDKVSGKVLSSNDFTTALLNKLNGIEANANNYTYTLPEATESLLGGIKVGNGLEVSSGVVSVSVPTENDFTDTLKTKLEGITAEATKVAVSENNGKILINGVEKTIYTLPSNVIKEDDNISKLTNDANYATEEYVSLNGGKIDKITLGGVEQTITDKTIALPAYPTLAGLGGASASDLSALSGRVGTNETAISTINGKISSSATSTNKLVDRDTMNSTINSLAAFFRGNYPYQWTYTPDGGIQKVGLLSVAWQTTNPDGDNYVSNNDYAYVEEVIYNAGNTDHEWASTHEGESWRYIYISGEGWQPQFKVNDTAFTSDQLSAINSGISSTLVGKITSNETAIGVNSGKIDVNTSAISTINSSDVMTSGITSSKVSGYDTHITNNSIHVTASDKSTWNGKQNAITSSSKLSAELVSGLGTVATTNSYNDLDDLPTIPTITDTYSATSSDGMSGKAVASAIANLASKSTTLAGYGITDANISSGVITLGSNTITPLTSSSSISGSNVTGTVPSATSATKLADTTISETSGSQLVSGTDYVITSLAWDSVNNRYQVTKCKLPSDRNTDTNVTQTYSTTNKNYALLASGTYEDTADGGDTATSSVWTNKITINPSTGNLKATTVNGYTLAAACAKGVETTVANDGNLPTGSAIVAYASPKAGSSSLTTCSQGTFANGACATFSLSGSTLTITQG